MIGVVCDNESYASSLEQALCCRRVDLPPDACLLPVHQQGCDKVSWKGDEIDVVLIYVHCAIGFRQANRGLEWLKEFRARTFRVPAILLSWWQGPELWLRNLQNGCFASPYFKDSCASLRFPVSKGDLQQILGKLRPTTPEELEQGLVFELTPWLSHRVSRLLTESNVDEIKRDLVAAMTRYPNSFVENAVTPLLCSSTVEEFRVKANVLLRPTMR